MIIANVSPAREHSHETASTLAFAARCKRIRNSAVVNQTCAAMLSSCAASWRA